MPTYNYACRFCHYAWETNLPIAERDVPLIQPCPHCTEEHGVDKLVTAPGLCDPMRIGRVKPDKGFRDLLMNIKSKHRGSTIDVDSGR